MFCCLPLPHHLVIQLHKVLLWHRQVEVNTRMGRSGQADCRFAQSLVSALYSKKLPSLTAFFSFTASQIGRPVKNSSGSPVAMLATMQAYR